MLAGNPHGSHFDIRPGGYARILFDREIYADAHFSSSWRVAISAHEWWHNLGLADHDNDNPCPPSQGGIDSVMGKAIPNPLGTACIQGPTTNDLNSVACNVYKLCAGVRVASGDVDGDGCDEIITSAGPGPMSWVRVWDALTGYCITSTSGIWARWQFLAYDEGFLGGVYVGAGNVDPSTGNVEVITGAGEGGGPHVRVWKMYGLSSIVVGDFFAFGTDFTGGVRVGASDMNCAGGEEILAATGPGGYFVQTHS